MLRIEVILAVGFQEIGYRVRQVLDFYEASVREKQVVLCQFGSPSFGRHAFGSTFFQYLLCSMATWKMVSVAASEAVIGSSWGGMPPNRTCVTANAELAIASRQ